MSGRNDKRSKEREKKCSHKICPPEWTQSLYPRIRSGAVIFGGEWNVSELNAMQSSRVIPFNPVLSSRVSKLNSVQSSRVIPFNPALSSRMSTYDSDPSPYLMDQPNLTIFIPYGASGLG